MVERTQIPSPGDQNRPAGDGVFALLDMLHGSWKSQALCVAARLGIADVLAESPLAASELAGRCVPTCAPHALGQLLDALCTLSIVDRLPDGRYALGTNGRWLRTGVPESLRHWVIWWGQSLWPVWGELWYSVTTGRSARAMLNGTSGFDHLGDPEQARIFHLAMAELSSVTVAAITDAVDFSRFCGVVDIGGGDGTLLAAILRRWPHAAGALLDLDHAVARARDRFERDGLGPRVRCEAGDFFREVPRPDVPGSAAYLIKSVIHDWSDDDAVRILRACRASMRPERADRLLLAEQVLPDVRTPSAWHQSLSRSDLTMLVAHGAGERTRTHFATLLQRAGFSVARVTPAGPTFSVIEGVPSS